MDSRSPCTDRAAVRLNCLGNVELTVDGRPVGIKTGRKAVALLAVLAAEPGHRVSRETLAALLWEGRFEEQARQSLRQLLSQLRRDLDAQAPGILSIDRDWVALVACACDVASFEAAVARGDGARAAGIWRGDFAANVDIDGEAWRNWRETVRARLRPAAVWAFEAAARAARDAKSRLDAAEQILGVDPVNEAAIRIAVPALVETRGAASAASRFESFVDTLRRETGRAPLAETMSVYADALSAVPAATVRARTSGSARFLRPGAVVAMLAILGVLGALAYGHLREDETAGTMANAGAFIEARQIRWPFRFFVGEPRPTDREPETLRVAATLDDDLRAALGALPGSGIAAGQASADFVVDADVRSGDGGRLAINLRLVERRSGRVLWADTLAGVERYAATERSQRAAPIESAVARAYAALLVEMDQRRPQTPPPAPEVAEAVREGWAALRGGANREKVDRSDAAFRRAYALDPESPDARIGMAQSLAMYLVNGWSDRRAEDAATAVRLIGETIDRSARQPVAFFVLGLVHKSQRDYARGIAAMRVALQIQPNHSASYAQSAHMYLLNGDVRSALELAELGVLLGPDANALDRALLYAGMARFLVGDDALALRHLERSFAINRTFPDIYAWYAATLHSSGRGAEARDLLEQMRRRWPGHRFDHHVMISHFPQAMSRFSTALADLERDGEFPRAADAN